jgi:hypothetical protein
MITKSFILKKLKAPFKGFGVQYNVFPNPRPLKRGEMQTQNDYDQLYSKKAKSPFQGVWGSVQCPSEQSEESPQSKEKLYIK